MTTIPESVTPRKCANCNGRVKSRWFGEGHTVSASGKKILWQVCSVKCARELRAKTLVEGKAVA